jgi:GH15 family glucan-1,4-alpha-glucosidase
MILKRSSWRSDGQLSHVTRSGQENSTLRQSIKSILRNQSESGAFAASVDFSQYRFSWLRDGSFCAYALDRAGEHEASARYHSWVNDAIENISGVIDSAIEQRGRGESLDPMTMPPARFALDGSIVNDGWPNFQIDGYGTWLWSLGEHLTRTEINQLPAELSSSVARTARYLATFALSPCYDVWEENGTALHSSTLACVYGGLIASSRLLDDPQLLIVAAQVRKKLVESGITHGIYAKSTESDNVDASALWLLTPFGVVDASDGRFTKTVAAIEKRLTFEGGLRRYSADVYFGSGAWPVLTASLGWHRLTVGDLAGATECLDWITNRFDKLGRLGEQYGGERRDPEHYQQWVDRWGLPAQDLTWSHAMYVVLSIAIEEVESSLSTTNLVSSFDSQSVDKGERS